MLPEIEWFEAACLSWGYKRYSQLMLQAARVSGLGSHASDLNLMTILPASLFHVRVESMSL